MTIGPQMQRSRDVRSEALARAGGACARTSRPPRPGTRLQSYSVRRPRLPGRTDQLALDEEAAQVQLTGLFERGGGLVPRCDVAAEVWGGTACP